VVYSNVAVWCTHESFVCTHMHHLYVSMILGGTHESTRCCCVVQYVAVCCRALQCVAGELTRDSVLSVCSVLQCVAVCCSVLQCVAVSCSVLQCVAMCCSVLQYVASGLLNASDVAVYCSVLLCVAVCCSVLLCDKGRLARASDVAVGGSVLQ